MKNNNLWSSNIGMGEKPKHFKRKQGNLYSYKTLVIPPSNMNERIYIMIEHPYIIKHNKESKDVDHQFLHNFFEKEYGLNVLNLKSNNFSHFKRDGYVFEYLSFIRIYDQTDYNKIKSKILKKERIKKLNTVFSEE